MADSFELEQGDPAVPDAVDAAARAVRSGALVVFPTETVYGIACGADLPRATARLFAAKRRTAGLALPVMAATAGAALALGRPTAAARALAAAFWPGPLTIVMKRSERSAGWALGEHAGTIAIRVPDHAVASALLARTGPLAVSSANISGREPAATRDDLTDAFGDLVAVYLTQRESLRAADHPSSTVVDTAGGAVRILREGELTEATIRSVLLHASSAGHSVD